MRDINQIKVTGDNPIFKNNTFNQREPVASQLPQVIKSAKTEDTQIQTQTVFHQEQQVEKGLSKELLLFVHGLGGNSEKTWGNFPRLIREDKQLNERFDMGFYSFPTSLFGIPFLSKIPKIQDLANGLKTQIDNQYIQYSSIILVCHSLGGLIARQYLLEALKNNNLLKCKKLLLYAVPNNGATLASLVQYIPFSNNQLKQLAKNADLIEFLNEDWSKSGICNQIQIKNVIAGLDRVVDKISARQFWGNADIETIIEKGHINVVKPLYSNDLAFIILKNFVTDYDNPHQGTQLEKEIEEKKKKSNT